MSKRQRKRHSPEQIVMKFRDADAMLNAEKNLSAMLPALEASDATFHRWRNQYSGMENKSGLSLTFHHA